MSDAGMAQEVRKTANHCTNFVNSVSRSAEPVSCFPELSSDLAKTLGAMTEGLVSGGRHRVLCSAEERIAPAELLERIGPMAANGLISFGDRGARMLISLGISDLLGVTDRVFGGDGDVDKALPEDLPLTADLVAARIESITCDALANALQPTQKPDIVSRGTDVMRLDMFEGAKECVVFTLTVTEQDQADWQLTFAARPEHFAALFCGKPKQPVANKTIANPLTGPFADLPLDLEAVMAEFSIPLSRLSTLTQGDTIPLALSREVPLKISETIIAYGTVGATDERVALQLTRAF